MSKRIQPAQQVKQLGTILSVWAHPDDESYQCAGIMAEAVANGQTVVCLTATKGEQGVQDARRWPPERLAEIRAAEMQQAMAELGIRHHFWLGYHDGACRQADPAAAAAQIRRYIEEYQPQTVLTFGPDGMTGHPDHCTVSAWADQAVQGTAITVYHAVQLRSSYEQAKQADEQFNIFFNIDAPPLVEEADCDVLLHLKGERLNQKYRALSAMPSQTEAMFKSVDRAMLEAMIGSEAFVLAGQPQS